MAEQVHTISIKDEDYPSSLRYVFNPPQNLFIRGNLPDLEGKTAIAVIGTRHASPYGLKMGRNIAYEIASCGGVVISGLTAGIDSAAAEGALLAGGTVIGVLGTPVSDASSELAKEIEKTGCLISEYPPGTKSNRAFFRARNRIAAGLSEGVVVVEAPEKSGTRLFVAEALEQGKEIFAVPGNADSENAAGTLKFIKEGAKLITHGWEVAEEFPNTMKIVKISPEAELPVESKSKKFVDKENHDHYIDITEKLKGLDPAEITIVKAINSGCSNADEISVMTGLSLPEISRNLTMLQIKSFIIKEAAGFAINFK